MKSIRKSVQKGFTLVELLIVVIILALLAAIVVPQFASSTDEAKLASLDTTLSNMRAAIDLYYQQHGEYPAAKTSSASGCGGTPGDGNADSTDAFFQQLTLYTDGEGGACSIKDSTFKYGPYLKKPTLPANPITGESILVINTTGDLAMAGDSTSSSNWGGWKYDTTSGKFIANDNTDPDGVSGPEPSYDQR